MTKPPNAWKRMQNRYGWPYGPLGTGIFVVVGVPLLYAAIWVVTVLAVSVQELAR
jgi:hypothetical protein